MEKITFKEFKMNLIAQPFFVWNSLEKNETEFDLDNFWHQDIEQADTTAAQVIMSTFSKIDDELCNKLISKGAKVLSGSIEEKIIETKKYKDSNKIIINPVFEYQGAISKPFAFDFENKIIINLKYSKKTKRIDFMKAYYDYSIIKKAHFLINDYNLYLPKDTKGPKGKIDLVCVNHINLSKTGDSYHATLKNGSLKSIPVLNEIKDPSGKFLIKDIDLYIEEINNAKKVSEISSSLERDVTEFGYNPYFEELTKKIDHNYSGFSGNVISKAKIVNNEEIDNNVFNTYKSIDTSEIINMDAINYFLNLIKSSERIIWYDFEGFSLPFPVIDDTKPYQQMVFQLSKIETDNQVKEKEVENLIWDPKFLNEKDLYEIIKAVYSNGASKYIVYNKSYENTRLKEMVILLEDTEFEEEAIDMFDHINHNTIDLWDLFRITNGGKNVPPIMMNDQKCKSSIKNIEKHISENKIDVGYQIKEYKNLDVKNGGMAMEIAIKRSTGLIGDIEWKQKTSQLKEYCENDVKMMLMVYHYVIYLLKTR